MNLEETKAKAEKLRKDAERISEEAKLCADLDEATEMHEEAFAALYEAAELQKRIEAYEKARQEFAWSIRTSRLCAAAVRTHLKPETSKEEAERTTKAEALEYVEAARKHCAKWLKTERQWGNLDEGQAEAAKEAVEDMAEELTKQANELPE